MLNQSVAEMVDNSLGRSFSKTHVHQMAQYKHRIYFEEFGVWQFFKQVIFQFDHGLSIR